MVSSGYCASHGQRSCSRAIVPDTSGAANDVPERRINPPIPSDTRIASPGATMKRFKSRFCA